MRLDGFLASCICKVNTLCDPYLGALRSPVIDGLAWWCFWCRATDSGMTGDPHAGSATRDIDG